jgi:hypothetical protein
MTAAFRREASFYHDDFRPSGVRSAGANASIAARNAFVVRTLAYAKDIDSSTRIAATSRSATARARETCQAISFVDREKIVCPNLGHHGSRALRSRRVCARAEARVRHTRSRSGRCSHAAALALARALASSTASALGLQMFFGAEGRGLTPVACRAQAA